MKTYFYARNTTEDNANQIMVNDVMKCLIILHYKGKNEMQLYGKK